MSSFNGNGALSPVQATELKAALKLPSPPQVQQTKGATLPREKSAGLHITDIVTDSSSQAKSSNQQHSASATSLFRLVV